MRLSLSDGESVEIRPVRPEDKGEFVRSFELLGAESRYRRFFTAKPRLSERELRYLTEVDGDWHVALVAVLETQPPRGVGVARFVRSKEEPSVAEPAVVVIDEMQGRGIGHALLEALTAEAIERGVRSFRADVLSDNGPVRHLLDGVGGLASETDDPLIVSYDVPIASREAAAHGGLWRIFSELASGAWAARRGVSRMLLASATLKHRNDSPDEDVEKNA